MTDSNRAVDEEFMRRCLALAVAASRRGDAPVGSLIVQGGRQIAAASEFVDSALDIAGHAELAAIRQACRALGTLDLTGCVLYTTVEPCFMCSYAIRQTGISRVVIGAPVASVGGVTSGYPILTATDIATWPAPPRIVQRVLAAECQALLANPPAAPNPA